MLSRNVIDKFQVARDKNNGMTVRRLTAADLPAVIEIDRRVFGGDRRELLEWALETAPDYARVIESDAGVQYCFGRAGRLFDQIGPVVANNDADAAALVDAALKSAGGQAAVADVFDEQGRFATCLQRRGFVSQRPLFRMRRPGSRDITTPASPAGANGSSTRSSDPSSPSRMMNKQRVNSQSPTAQKIRDARFAPHEGTTSRGHEGSVQNPSRTSCRRAVVPSCNAAARSLPD